MRVNAEEFRRIIAGLPEKAGRSPVLAYQGGRIVLCLPFPPYSAGQNCRDWRPKAKATAKLREAACLAALDARRLGNYLRRWRSAKAEVLFFAPDARRRDPSNLIAACKGFWDGLVDAGLLVDDDRFFPSPGDVKIDRDNPRVEVTLWEVIEA